MSMHFVKCKEPGTVHRAGLCTEKPHPQRQISRKSCDGGYLDVKVSIFQVQRKEPVPWAYLRQDLFQCNHPERPSHEGTVQEPEIEDGSQAAIHLGDEEVTAVEA